MEGMKLLRLWCCFFVFYISNLLSYIQNNFSYELARPIMGTIFLVYNILHRECINTKISMRVQQCVRYARSLLIMVRAISVYSAGMPYAARFTAAVKILLLLATFRF